MNKGKTLLPTNVDKPASSCNIRSRTVSKINGACHEWASPSCPEASHQPFGGRRCGRLRRKCFRERASSRFFRRGNLHMPELHKGGCAGAFTPDHIAAVLVLRAVESRWIAAASPPERRGSFWPSQKDLRGNASQNGINPPPGRPPGCLRWNIHHHVTAHCSPRHISTSSPRLSGNGATMLNTFPLWMTRMSAVTSGLYRITDALGDSDCACWLAKNSRPLMASSEAQTVTTFSQTLSCSGAQNFPKHFLPLDGHAVAKHSTPIRSPPRRYRDQAGSPQMTAQTH